MDLMDFLVQSKYEVLLFLVAGVVYWILCQAHTDAFATSVPKLAANLPRTFDGIVQLFHASFQDDDIRTALRCWHALKRFEDPPAEIPLAQVVEALQRYKKDSSFIVKEIRAVLRRHSVLRTTETINVLLDALSRRLDSDMMEHIVELSLALGMDLDQHSYDMLLHTYFATRNFKEVRKVDKEMQEKKLPRSLRGTIILLKTSLKENKLEEACRYLHEIQTVAGEQDGMLAHFVGLVVDVACKQHALKEVIAALSEVPITRDVFHAMLANACKHKDDDGTRRILALRGEPLDAQSFVYLLKTFPPEEAMPFFEQAMTMKDLDWTAELAQRVIALAGKLSNATLVDRLLEAIDLTVFGTAIFASVAKLYNDVGEYAKACDIYEKHLEAGKNVDSRLARALLNAALRCERSDLAKRMIDSDPNADLPRYIASIRAMAVEGNLPGALQVFYTLENNGMELNSVMYNAVLDACVECKDLAQAKTWMERTKQKNMVDIVSYNTLIKAHLAHHNFPEARALMDEMRSLGLQPNRVTYNELVNAMASKPDERDHNELWKLVKEMQEAKVRPNHVTCSILLKCLNCTSSDDEILRTMDLIQQLEEPMDEVLLSSVVEACVRIGKPDLLTAKLLQLQSVCDGVTVSGAHTFGSLIKAYGHAKDIGGAWRCWKQMRSRHIKPTSITFGCMVEAIVMNGDAEAAYDLIQQMQEDEECAQCLNAVIYCSVLKGFTREKKIDRVWALYEEMQKSNIELSIVTFNTLIDACARSGSMKYVAQLLADMKARQIRPNVITYSTMLKGHCQEGNVDMGFRILEQMKTETKLRPDEIMFNSLLDGCAQKNLVDKALALLKEMEAANVKPSNFTVSILVKLMNRCHRLDEAFEISDRISTKYQFLPNVHVYTNLIQACIHHRQLPRALGVLERMIATSVHPDGRTFTVIIRGCLNHGKATDAALALRTALALPGGKYSARSVAKDYQLDVAVIDETLTRLVDADQQQAAQDLLKDIKECCSHIRIDSRTAHHVQGQRQNEAAKGGKSNKGWKTRGKRDDWKEDWVESWDDNSWKDNSWNESKDNAWKAKTKKSGKGKSRNRPAKT